MKKTEVKNELSETSHIGTVVNTETAGNYIYLHLTVEGKEVWIATVPDYLTVSVGKGDKVEYVDGLHMSNFTSKALGKTFDSLYFISKIKVVEKNSVLLPSDDYHNEKTANQLRAIPPRAGEIEKAINGKTVSEIFSERNTLKDKEVILKAKVMKVSKNILKKNWITLQDGTGTSPNDTIIFVTEQSPQLNDLITVTGIVKTDVNLGGGYKYKVLIEESTKSKKEKKED